ncbi:late embryogenesis abundant protein D-29 [Cucumis sativus]|uniref:Late embryogenesis abundant protein D-29 n=1 Tax=Cucumis sativus TaxID=3659 RepID=A0A0A0KUJ5_CUCSA|nr:late embryogenesis abundant protein D-29 [Cucumis sativus]KGN53305.1 hypothetical protein Csa_015110 [Cucumis sativus]
MGRKTRTLVVAVVWLVLVAEKCSGFGEEAVKDVKNNMSEIAEGANLDEKAEAVKSKASEVYTEAKDKTESWSNWAYNKISRGLGLNEEEIKETAHNVADKAGDAAIKTTEKINTAASDASNYASEKAGEAAKAASEAASKLKSKSEGVVGPAAEKVKETLVSGKDKAAEMYEAAKEKKNENCETAREMASKTAGEIGCRIREKSAEL